VKRKDLVWIVTSWAAAFIPVAATCFFTVCYPLTHELFHQVGFSLLSIPAVVIAYPTPTGVIHACVALVPVLKCDGFGVALFQYLSLAVSFPYLVCFLFLASICLVYLCGILTEKKWWFASTLIGALAATVFLSVCMVYPAFISEWVTDLASSFFSNL